MKTSSKPEDVTRLLLAWQNGDRQAFDQLMPLVYDELHRLAARHMRIEKPGHTLQTTALVNEAYCKLIDQREVQWQNRLHFFAMAAQLMRRILIDHARKRVRLKRGRGEQKISLDEVPIVSNPKLLELLSLDEALTQLAEIDPQKSRIVEMKFFGGLSTEEIAEVERVSSRTVQREWRKAKAWLYDEIKG